MANPEHLKILKQGVEVWNRWRAEKKELKPDLSEANLSRANLSGADFDRGDLSKADLFMADLSEAEFYRADLSEANLFMANLYRAYLPEANLSRAILFGVNLAKAELSKAYLMVTVLYEANLSKANLSEATLSGADLSKADLSGANLFKASLPRANLSMANLSKADLCRATLSEADLSGADFSCCLFNATSIVGVDLRETRNLEHVNHAGPSYLDTHTIFGSEGYIPESFLRGCGVHENLIQYMSSLSGKAFEYYSCFISYSSKDQDFADRFYSDLQNKGVRCWFAPEDMKIGDKIRDRIDQSIRIHDKLLLILSEHSINSEWVEDEVDAAYEQERQRGKTVLFPIRLDSAVMDTGNAWAAKLRRSRHIGDFTRWEDHDAYQKGLDRLMRDLKADKPVVND